MLGEAATGEVARWKDAARTGRTTAGDARRKLGRESGKPVAIPGSIS
jgi:hypothetical protein